MLGSCPSKGSQSNPFFLMSSSSCDRTATTLPTKKFRHVLVHWSFTVFLRALKCLRCSPGDVWMADQAGSIQLPAVQPLKVQFFLLIFYYMSTWHSKTRNFINKYHPRIYIFSSIYLWQMVLMLYSILPFLLFLVNQRGYLKLMLTCHKLPTSCNLVKVFALKRTGGS